MTRIKFSLRLGVAYVDRVLFGTRLGKLVIIGALLAVGVPALEAVPAADMLNQALDAVTVGA